MGKVTDERSTAQFFFEMGFGACYAEAIVSSGVVPFPLTDREVERQWAISREAYDDPAELDAMLARTNNHAELVEALREGETLETIIAWGDQTFGPCSQERAIERAGEEWTEMEEDGADVPIEAADVIICLLRIPGILDAINRKMTINRGRTWDVRPDGTGYHVKSAALSLYGGEKP